MGEFTQDYPGRSGYLVDLTQVQVNLSITDLYAVPEVLRAKSETFSRNRALVVKPEDRDKFDFLEITAANRGYRIRIFTERAQAEEWLGASD